MLLSAEAVQNGQLLKLFSLFTNCKLQFSKPFSFAYTCLKSKDVKTAKTSFINHNEFMCQNYFHFKVRYFFDGAKISINSPGS